MTGNKEELEMLTMSDKVMNLLLTSGFVNKLLTIENRQKGVLLFCGLRADTIASRGSSCGPNEFLRKYCQNVKKITILFKIFVLEIYLMLFVMICI